MTQHNFTIGAYQQPTMKYSSHRNVSLTFLAMIPFVCYATDAVAIETPNLTQPKIIVPEKISGVETITAEQLIETLTSDKPPILIDARIKSDREYGHIESSIGLPDIKTNCDTLSKITADKDRHLIFYCNGVQCGRSVISIKIARSCGYRHLSWFKGGFAEWSEKGYQYIRSR